VTCDEHYSPCSMKSSDTVNRRLPHLSTFVLCMHASLEFYTLRDGVDD